ncbi:MAG: amidase [bacterium]
MRNLTIACGMATMLLLAGCGEEISGDLPIDDATVRAAEALSGLDLTQAERTLMLEDLAESRQAYRGLRGMEIPNAVPPALRFDPLTARTGLREGPATGPAPVWSPAPEVTRPDDLEDLAFATIGELAELIRTRRVSCLELTELALDRLRRHGPDLECVVTLTEGRALRRARELDRMLDRGEYLGPLHGIPYGAKDLLAVRGYPTTWGARPYRNRILNGDATVVEKLDQAGAVLVAKLTLGALAWGDVWFGGTTRNPWNLEQGSSGSSAGPASAVAAGLVPFAIGSETWGSIVSPSTRCGTTGLRPTFGRVSRQGAMALSWSMDKIGPMARTVEDCAIVFDAIEGIDPADPTTVDRPFPYRPDRPLQDLRIGYLRSVFNEEYDWHTLHSEALDDLRRAGARLVPVELPGNRDLGTDIYNLSFILSAEAGAAFQDLVLSDRDDELVRQVRNAWPNVFRHAQFIPAVEYIQANRARVRLMELMAGVFDEIDVYVTPSFQGDNLLITNLTGHPQVVVPCGFETENAPTSISFVGRLYGEADVLAVAKAYQDATGWHRMHPPGF